MDIQLQSHFMKNLIKAMLINLESQVNARAIHSKIF